MTPRHLPLLLALSSVLFSASCVAVSVRPDQRLHCRADGELECAGDACRFRPGEAIQVELTLDAGEAGGELCTWTYCRDFSWLLVLGDRSPQRTFGPIRSASSGSTEDLREVPVVDYHLWVSADRGRFALLPVEPGGATWVGACAGR